MSDAFCELASLRQKNAHKKVTVAAPATVTFLVNCRTGIQSFSARLSLFANRFHQHFTEDGWAFGDGDASVFHGGEFGFGSTGVA